MQVSAGSADTLSMTFNIFIGKWQQKAKENHQKNPFFFFNLHPLDACGPYPTFPAGSSNSNVTLHYSTLVWMSLGTSIHQTLHLLEGRAWLFLHQGEPEAVVMERCWISPPSEST